jgi:cyclic beta-1,2-glucan synthetase
MELFAAQGLPKYEMTLRYRTARYRIVVENPDAVSRDVASAHLDGVPITERPLRLPLVDDGNTHHIDVRLGQLP